MSIATNLYPPLIADSQAAFIRTNTCKIYFSLSAYNSIDDIANVQISLINQKTNASALKTAIYPSEIKIAELEEDFSIQNDFKYYVEISKTDLDNNEFELNQFYKVQLRFTSTSAAPAPNSGTNLANWLSTNIANFSEWSTVCLIKGIEQPQISIHNFSENSAITLFSPTINIVGKIYFNNINEKEYLKNYKIQIYEKEKLIANSEIIYANQFNPNEFNYELETQAVADTDYTMYFTFTTINGYTETKSYDFSIAEAIIEKLNVDISATADNQNGRVKIIITSQNSDIFIGNLTIRRTSSDSNFNKWEDVKNFVLKINEPLNLIWYDYTAESGTWYKYCVQKRNKIGFRGAMTVTPTPVMCEFEDMFLTRDGCQLKIQFNPSLNEFKYNVTESQQITLGSKFPFIKRNGNNYYRSFPIGGLISSFSDTTDWYDPHYYNNEFHTNENEIKAFTSKDAIYGDYKNYYDNYNSQNNIKEYQDRIYERKFREKVYKFLYENNIKLFKSTTEGNILVKLMNIDFQPVESLGRSLYSFTATAVEVDEPTLVNYEYYGIQLIGDIETKNISYEYEILGQLYGHRYTEELLSTTLKTKYQRKAPSGHEITVKKLTWLKIEIYSDPYIIIEKNGELKKATSNSVIDSNAVSGYIVEINGVQMILKNSMVRRTSDATNLKTSRTIDSIGYFELNEKNIEITSLKFKYEVDAVIDYIAVIESKENIPIISSAQSWTTWGQLYNSFESKDSIIQKILNKYSVNYTTYAQKLINITHVKIQAPIGTVVYIKDSKSPYFNRHVLETGYLELQDDEVSIEGIYFYGINLKQHKEISSALKKDEYYLVPGYYDNFLDIKNPIPNGVYQLSDLIVENAISFDESSDLLTVSPTDVLQEVDAKYSLLFTLDKNINEQLLDESNQSISLIAENSASFDESSGLITLSFQNVFQEADAEYSLLLTRIIDEINGRYIYYQNKWYPISPNGDIPIKTDSAIIDYYGTVLKMRYLS